VTRVAVFIDYQNAYMGARRAFSLGSDFTNGQFYPRRLGVALAHLGRTVDPKRELHTVQVFRGEPSSAHSPKGLAACQRQVRYWQAQRCVEPVTRPLKYYSEWNPRRRDYDWQAREKGIDVLIALAMVTGAHADAYDVAILMSADSDLLPALEQVMDAGKRVEVATWDGPGSRSRLSLPGKNIWCHWLDRQWYDRLHDPTDYTLPQADEPPTEP
jgi:uncharacterized LabA/DUF88 family protein